MSAKSPPVPSYGADTLAEVMPQVGELLSATKTSTDAFGLLASLGPRHRVCVHLVDGLGWDMIEERADVCPTLSSLARRDASRPIRSCIPSTTVTSLASFGTGLPPGRHGIVGYTMYMKGLDTVLNTILFTRHGDSRGGSLADKIVPEELQPHVTVFEDLARDGIPVFAVSDAGYEGSPLSRATLRGSGYVGWRDISASPSLIAGLFEDHARLVVFSYDPRLDRVGHTVGVRHGLFDETLAAADDTVRQIVDVLPDDACLLVTGDHGMMDVTEEDQTDLEHEPFLLEGVVAVGGEPRFRHLHTVPGAAAEVAEIWRDAFGDAAWIRRREDAIAEGWFGPEVSREARLRIGDVVVAFSAPLGVFQSDVDPLAARLVGHHGSFTSAESVVPLLVHATT